MLAAKFIDKKEDGQEIHTSWFVGKPGEILNNSKATPKHHKTYNMPESGTHEAHSWATRTTPLAVLTENHRIDLICHEPLC
jgi:hypothetical protein